MTTTASQTSVPAPAAPAVTPESGRAWPPGEILRDITRGGVSGLIVGITVAGLGGRLAMRFAALAVPGAVGSFTENGNRIGDITLEGSLGLVVFVGLFFGLVAGTLWVTISPWIPGTPAARALLAMPIAVALGATGLIEGRNPDFSVLGREPVVVAILVALVALIGAALALVDPWLDRRLPHAGSEVSKAAGTYAALAVLGVTLAVVAVLPVYLLSDLLWVGVSLVAVGIATLASWVYRARGRARPPVAVSVLGYGGLASATVIGLAAAAREVAEALGLA